MKKTIDGLRLDTQLCFPLYVAAKETVRKYRPFLDELNLTYTQYITMIALWETDKQNLKDLGNRLFLDSGTLTPVLKSLEYKGYIARSRLPEDERNLIIALTKKGEELKHKAKKIPSNVEKEVNLTNEEFSQLYTLLHKILDSNK